MSRFTTETTRMKRSFSTFLVDVFTGFLEFATVKAVSIFTRQHQDIRPFLLATFAAFCIASFSRTGGRSSRALIAALLVALGGIVPAIVINRLGMSWTAPHLLSLYIAMSAASVVLGASTRTLILLGRMGSAALLGGISAVAAIFLVLETVPRLLTQDAFRHVDQNISSFHIRTFEGANLDSSEWRGHVVIVSFWATWCLLSLW